MTTERSVKPWRVVDEDGRAVYFHTETAARLRASLAAERDPRAPRPTVEHLDPEGWFPATRPEDHLRELAEAGPVDLPTVHRPDVDDMSRPAAAAWRRRGAGTTTRKEAQR